MYVYVFIDYVCIIVLNYYTNKCTYINFLHIKTLKLLRHVSVLRPSSGSCISLPC